MTSFFLDIYIYIIFFLVWKFKCLTHTLINSTYVQCVGHNFWFLDKKQLSKAVEAEMITNLYHKFTCKKHDTMLYFLSCSFVILEASCSAFCEYNPCCEMDKNFKASYQLLQVKKQISNSVVVKRKEIWPVLSGHINTLVSVSNNSTITKPGKQRTFGGGIRYKRLNTQLDSNIVWHNLFSLSMLYSKMSKAYFQLENQLEYQERIVENWLVTKEKNTF